MQLTLEVALSGVGAVIAASVAALVWRRWENVGSTALVGFNLAVAVWAGGNALQAASTGTAAKLLWVNLQYVGIAAVPVTVFWFAAAINGLEAWTRPRRLAALGAPLVALVVLSWTDALGMHDLVRASATTRTVDGTAVLDRTFGPAFWAGWAYSNLLNVIATLLVLRAVIYARDVLRYRTLALVGGATVPWIAHVLYLAGAIAIEPESFFAVTGVAFAIATFRYGEDQLQPVARDVVFELLDDGIVVVDGDGRIIDCNDAARRLLRDDDLLGESVETTLADYPDLDRCYRNGENRDVALGDGERHVDVRIAELPAVDGSRRSVLVLRDVTALKERERELERRNERLERVRDVLAHDLRNPLNVAEGHLTMAREGDEGALDGIANAHDRIETLIEDVLTLAETAETIEETRIDLGRVAHEAWASVETGDATFAIEDGETRIEADPDRLRQLLENLFRNAIEHAGEDVTVRLGDVEEVVRSEGERSVGFYVEDDGPGIPPEEREHVFEYGHSGGGGTGFGLAIVEDIAAAHGWQVRVTDGETGGARFEFVDLA